MAAPWKTRLAPFALTVLGLTAACGEAQDAAPPSATMDEGTQTLAAALSAEERLDTLQEAMERSGLAGVFDGPASYTILAPEDAAFAALGKDGTALFEDAQRPVLVAILRDHLLPGHLTRKSIGAAIDRSGGPVTMTSLGQNEVTFARSDDAITVSTGDGATARIAGTAIAANNGVVIPLDTVLLPPRQDAAPNSRD